MLIVEADKLVTAYKPIHHSTTHYIHGSVTNIYLIYSLPHGTHFSYNIE